MSEELVAKREKYWWEHYPLHQLWCNDACPLVPRFEYRKGDEWNANNWSLHWLIFHIWTLEHFSFGALHSRPSLSWPDLLMLTVFRCRLSSVLYAFGSKGNMIGRRHLRNRYLTPSSVSSPGRSVRKRRQPLPC